MLWQQSYFVFTVPILLESTVYIYVCVCVCVCVCVIQAASNTSLNKKEAQRWQYKILYQSYTFVYIHYIAKSIGSPPSNERFDNFSHFHEYKS